MNRLINEGQLRKLPKLLQEVAIMGESEREKDLLVLSTLVLVSGCLPGGYGYYMKRKVYCNLYLFIVGDAGAGKGALAYVKKLALPLHDWLVAEARVEGDLQTLFIPANSSAAAFYQALEENNGSGIIFETEADTLSMALAKEWGDYSDALRKAFHHEAITSRRMGDPKSGIDHKIIDIEVPRVAAVISGTPGQVKPLIDSSENGLFSRFMFCVIDGEEKWIDVSPGEGGWNLDDSFKALSLEYDALFQFNRSHPFEFQLTNDQWTTLNEHFKTLLEDPQHKHLAGTIKRLGIITFRLCMILTAFRRHENSSIRCTEVCDQEDFLLALDLSVGLFKNAAKLANIVIAATVLRPSKRLLNALPTEFRRAEAQEIGKSLGFSEHSIDIYLKNEVEGGCLEKLQNGVYRKTPQ